MDLPAETCYKSNSGLPALRHGRDHTAGKAGYKESGEVEEGKRGSLERGG